MNKDLISQIEAVVISDGYEVTHSVPPTISFDFAETCRKACSECKEFNSCWTCPPGIGTIETCSAKLTGYDDTFVLSKHFDLDPKSEAVVEADKELQEECRNIAHLIRENGGSALPIAGGKCMFCEECSYPNEECLFPLEQVPSMSGFGINIEKYLGELEIHFEFADDHITLYGLILYSL